MAKAKHSGNYLGFTANTMIIELNDDTCKFLKRRGLLNMDGNIVTAGGFVEFLLWQVISDTLESCKPLMAQINEKQVIEPWTGELRAPQLWEKSVLFYMCFREVHSGLWKEHDPKVEQIRLRYTHVPLEDDDATIKRLKGDPSEKGPRERLIKTNATVHIPFIKNETINTASWPLPGEVEVWADDEGNTGEEKITSQEETKELANTYIIPLIERLCTKWGDDSQSLVEQNIELLLAWARHNQSPQSPPGQALSAQFKSSFENTLAVLNGKVELRLEGVLWLQDFDGKVAPVTLPGLTSSELFDKMRWTQALAWRILAELPEADKNKLVVHGSTAMRIWRRWALQKYEKGGKNVGVPMDKYAKVDFDGETNTVTIRCINGLKDLRKFSPPLKDIDLYYLRGGGEDSGLVMDKVSQPKENFPENRTLKCKQRKSPGDRHLHSLYFNSRSGDKRISALFDVIDFPAPLDPDTSLEEKERILRGWYPGYKKTGKGESASAYNAEGAMVNLRVEYPSGSKDKPTETIELKMLSLDALRASYEFMTDKDNLKVIFPKRNAATRRKIAKYVKHRQFLEWEKDQGETMQAEETTDGEADEETTDGEADEETTDADE